MKPYEPTSTPEEDGGRPTAESVAEKLRSSGAHRARRDFPGETFCVLKEKEIRQFGEYRTQRLVLAGRPASRALGP